MAITFAKMFIMDTKDLLLDHYLTWMKTTSQKKTVKEFAEYIGLGYKLFAQLFNGTRLPTKKQTQLFAEFRLAPPAGRGPYTTSNLIYHF
jgi:hypothetical protein